MDSITFRILTLIPQSIHTGIKIYMNARLQTILYLIKLLSAYGNTIFDNDDECYQSSRLQRILGLTTGLFTSHPRGSFCSNKLVGM